MLFMTSVMIISDVECWLQILTLCSGLFQFRPCSTRRRLNRLNSKFLSLIYLIKKLSEHNKELKNCTLLWTTSSRFIVVNSLHLIPRLMWLLNVENLSQFSPDPAWEDEVVYSHITLNGSCELCEQGDLQNIYSLSNRLFAWHTGKQSPAVSKTGRLVNSANSAESSELRI